MIKLVSLLYVYSGSYWVVYLVTVLVYTAVKRGTETLPWRLVNRPDLFLHFTPVFSSLISCSLKRTPPLPPHSASASASLSFVQRSSPNRGREFQVVVRNTPSSCSHTERKHWLLHYVLEGRNPGRIKVSALTCLGRAQWCCVWMWSIWHVFAGKTGSIAMITRAKIQPSLCLIGNSTSNVEFWKKNVLMARVCVYMHQAFRLSHLAVSWNRSRRSNRIESKSYLKHF